MTGKSPGPVLRTWILPALLYLSVLAAISLWPMGGASDEIGRFCLLCGARGTADFVANVLLYVPLGCLLGFWFREGWRAVAWGLVVTLCVELAQLGIPGRYPTLGDVIANGTGAVVGLVAFRHRSLWLDPSPRSARRLCRGWAVAVVTILVLIGFLFGPSLPESTYWSQWTPDLGHMDHYEGRVLSARLGEIPLPSGRIDDSERVRDLLLGGDEIEVAAIAGPAPEDLAPIFSIHDEGQREILVLGARGVDFVHRARIRAEDYRLDRPAHRIPHGFRSVSPGDTLWLGVRLTPQSGGYRVHVAGRVYSLDYGVEDGWTLLVYSLAWPWWVEWVAGVLWLCALFAPVGWWASQMGTLVRMGGAMLAALALVPMWSNLGATGALAFGVAAGGLGLGSLARRIRRGALNRYGSSLGSGA